MSATASLWVKSEPFEFGIIHVPPPSKLLHHNLKKLFAYAKNKGKGGYPRISYAIWKHVACNKLQISEDWAWLYFQTCDAITEQNCELKLMVAEQYLGCKTDEEKSKWKERFSVDLLKFLIFLYIQHAPMISIKTSMVVGEEWPSRSRSPDLEGRAGIGAKTLDEHAQLQFVQNNLMEILELLVQPDAYGIGADGDSTLSLDALYALGFIISATDGRDIRGIDDLASRQSHAQHSGYSKISRSFSTRKLYKWIQSKLKGNPFGVSGCISIGQRLRGRAYSVGCDESLSASLGSSMCEELIRQNQAACDILQLQDSLSSEIDSNASIKLSHGSISNKIMSNANFAPACNHLMVFNQVCKRTIARTGEPLSKSTVKIHRCQYSYVYLLSPLRSVNIEKCHDTKIFLGPVETVVNMIACENVEVCAVTRKININTCRSCTFYLFTETRPVLIGSNENLKFAPYNTSYPTLVEDMTVVGLTISHNFWNEPLILGSDSSCSEKTWGELDSEAFFRLCIPFEMEGETKACPFKLPKKYEDALKRKEEALDDWHKMVSEAKLTRDQKKQLQSLVQNRFQDWLKDTGNHQLLESLTLQK